MQVKNLDIKYTKLRKMILNEVVTILPINEINFKISSPVFDIEGKSPAKIKIFSINPNIFMIRIVTDVYKLITLVPSFKFEVFNPDGLRTIKLIAPPK